VRRPIRVDPVGNLDKPALLKYGFELGFDVLRGAGMDLPATTVHWPEPHRHPERGWYRGRRVTVNLPRCRPPTGTPGYSWSYPGYKADMTPVGVVTHEIGHYVDELKGFPDIGSWHGEAAVSGYEPNRGEAFAEAFRLFCTNPDLLRTGRMIRWNTLVVSLRFEPDEMMHWEDVLRARGAHERIINAARNWVGRRA